MSGRVSTAFAYFLFEQYASMRSIYFAIFHNFCAHWRILGFIKIQDSRYWLAKERVAACANECWLWRISSKIANSSTDQSSIDGVNGVDTDDCWMLRTATSKWVISDEIVCWRDTFVTTKKSQSYDWEGKMAPSPGFEPGTHGLTVHCSNQLSYEGNGRIFICHFSQIVNSATADFSALETILRQMGL